jgi:hypothetical protein
VGGRVGSWGGGRRHMKVALGRCIGVKCKQARQGDAAASSSSSSSSGGRLLPAQSGGHCSPCRRHPCSSPCQNCRQASRDKGGRNQVMEQRSCIARQCWWGCSGSTAGTGGAAKPASGSSRIQEGAAPASCTSSSTHLHQVYPSPQCPHIEQHRLASMHTPLPTLPPPQNAAPGRKGST